jgi:hypothetical protein
MQWLALTFVLLFAAPVAAQEAGEPQAGAAYAKQILCKLSRDCGRAHVTRAYSAPFQGRRQYLWHDGYRVDDLASDFAPDHAQYHPRAERHEQCGCLYPQPKGLARRARATLTLSSEREGWLSAA